MGSVNHVGCWPWKDQTGTGPLGLNNPATNNGGVISGAFSPSAPTDFPFAVETKTDAMWWFWRVREWTFSLETPYFSHTDTLTTVLFGVSEEEDLITQFGGIGFHLPASSHGGPYGTIKELGGGFFIDAALRVSTNYTPDYPQVLYNPETDLWIPRITTYIYLLSTQGAEYTLALTTDPELSAYYGGASRVLAQVHQNEVEMSGQFDGFGPAVVSFTPKEYWSYGGAYSITTGAPL